MTRAKRVFLLILFLVFFYQSTRLSLDQPRRPGQVKTTSIHFKFKPMVDNKLSHEGFLC
jgi:hypothetical protein